MARIDYTKIRKAGLIYEPAEKPKEKVSTQKAKAANVGRSLSREEIAKIMEGRK